MEVHVSIPFCAIPAGGETVYSVLFRDWERSGIPQTDILKALTEQR
jgi:hypothetical protein